MSHEQHQSDEWYSNSGSEEFFEFDSDDSNNIQSLSGSMKQTEISSEELDRLQKMVSLPVGDPEESRKVRNVLGDMTFNMDDPRTSLYVFLALLGNDNFARAKVYLMKFGRLFRITDVESNHYWAWNHDRRLWMPKKMNSLVSCDLKYVVSQVYEDVIDALPNKADAKDDVDQIRSLLKKLRSKQCKNSTLKEVVGLFKDGIVDADFSSRLDADRTLLPVAGGQMVDLKTGQVRDRQFNDWCSKECPVQWNPDADSCFIRQFIGSMFLDDETMIEFFQTLLGYSITGLVDEEKMFILYGDSSAGKTTLANLLQSVLGSGFYASLHSSVLVKRGASSGGPDPFLAELQGRRVAVCSETNSDDKLQMAQVKQLSSKDKKPFRKLYQNNVELLDPTATIFLLTNFKPMIEDADKSIWRRICLIEMKARFVDHPVGENERPKNPKLDQELSKRENLEAMLVWMVQGSVRYFQEEKLDIPQVVQDETNEYKLEEDHLQAFLNECTEKNGKGKASYQNMYRTYSVWCDLNGQKKVMSGREFSSAMKKKGHVSFKSSTVWYKGMVLKKDADTLINQQTESVGDFLSSNDHIITCEAVQRSTNDEDER